MGAAWDCNTFKEEPVERIGVDIWESLATWNAGRKGTEIDNRNMSFCCNVHRLKYVALVESAYEHSLQCYTETVAFLMGEKEKEIKT